MGIDIATFRGTLPDSHDDFHVTAPEAGTVKLFNFEVDRSDLRPRHRDIIKELVVDFMVKATEALGPGFYSLRCVGFCSATGSFAHNKELSDLRRRQAGNFAIGLYEKENNLDRQSKSAKLVLKKLLILIQLMEKLKRPSIRSRDILRSLNWSGNKRFFAPSTSFSPHPEIFRPMQAFFKSEKLIFSNSNL
jgi:hypothetical protein